MPDLLGINQEGQEVRLSDFAGKHVVLYAYPKDNTSGCMGRKEHVWQKSHGDIAHHLYNCP